MDAPDWIGLYLQEDLGEAGDITSHSVVPADSVGAARVVARERCFLAGTHRAGEVFSRCGATIDGHMNDGSWIGPGAVVLTAHGPARGLLAAERTALNLLGRMSGVATAARPLVERLARECSGTVLCGTRKTPPGMRAFEKEALRIAGAEPHRMGLFDEAMVKDNHLAAAGGDVAAAVRAVRAAHPGRRLTVEVESELDALTAAAAGADCLLIDNQESATGRAWAEAVWAAHPGVVIEASGGITADNITAYGWADRISMGGLTTRARSVDFGLDWGEGA